jgi:sugar lactone lactonase YvrE
MKNTIITTLVLLSLCGSTWAIEVLEPGYTVETYATYSKPGIGKPRSMTFGGDNNLYVTQKVDGSVWHITPEGAASEFVSGLETPCGIVWGGGTSYGDHLYVVRYEVGGGGVYRIGLDGTVSNFANMPYGGHAPGPIGIDRTGNYDGCLYVGSTGQDHTYRVDTGGNVTKFSDFPGWYDGGGPHDIAFGTVADYGGLMYMSTSFVGVNQHRSGLFTLDTSGNASRFTDDLVAASRIDFDLIGDFDEEMFVTAKSGFDEPLGIWRVGPDGTATEFARTTISDPYGLAFGPDGAMYIAEYSSDDEMVIISRIIPEPVTVLLLGLGMAILYRRR